MNKLDVFLAGIRNKNYERLDWIRTLLCLVAEPEGKWKTESYPYRIVQQRDGYYYVDPTTNELVLIRDANVSEPLLKPSDVLTINTGYLPNVKQDTLTTVGNVLLNAISLCYAFGGKIEFMTGVMDIKKIEKEIVKRMIDDPPHLTQEQKAANLKDIYVSEYIRYTEAMLLVRALSDIVIPTASRKLLTPPPNVQQLRNKLIEENKDRMTDPAVIANIDKKLVEYDTQYLADDDAAQGFLLKGKYRNEVRRKLFLTVGAQAGFSDGVEVAHTAKSLSEGMDIKSFAVANSSMRKGSYSRGHETMLGGAKFKELLRAATNSQISMDDCKTTVGLPTNITKENSATYIGYYFIVDGKSVKITEENHANYVGRRVQVRSTMYCKASSTDYCKCCIGDKLALHPNALAVAVSDVGSLFLSMFLAKMHVSGQQTAKLDVLSSIN